jgi:hypothetical protein
MLKKFITSVVAAASLLSLVGAASAATTSEVNIYGASAQYLYWSSEAPNFVAAQGYTVTPVTKSKDSKNMIAWGYKANGDRLIVRVSSKASYDGILALQGSADVNHANECDSSDPTRKSRLMVDETSCSGANCTATKCVKVTVGASDVEGPSFVQSSYGALLGPNGGAITTRAFQSIDTTGLTDVRKMVVPFAFFANKGVTRLDSTGTATTITNISRMQAVMIFSGQAYNWTDFGAQYVANTPIKACMRHAGSGTAATLDLAVMSGKWGASMANVESAGGPDIWFNDGSSDEMNCVNQLAGAIGYADADQSTSSYPNTVRLNYNGVTPSADTIKNGEYDNFWTVQNCYYNPSDATYGALAGTACNYVDNIPASKTGYWAKVCQMNYMKDHDQNYPTYVGATCP